MPGGVHRAWALGQGVNLQGASRCLEASRRFQGVTLVELMAIMAVIALLGVFTAPGVSRVLMNIRLTSTTSEIASALHLARIKAITQNASMRIAFDVAQNTYQLQQRDTVDSKVWHAMDVVQRLPKDVTIASITGNPVEFQSGRGSAVPGSNSTITLQTRRGRQATIVIAQTGRVTVQRSN